MQRRCWVASSSIRLETNRITEALWQKVDQVVMAVATQVRAAKAVAVAVAPVAAQVRADIKPLTSEKHRGRRFRRPLFVLRLNSVTTLVKSRMLASRRKVVSNMVLGIQGDDGGCVRTGGGGKGR